MGFDRERMYQGAFLPHCEAGGRPQMITIRLHDSLPTDVLRRLQAEADEQRRRQLTEQYLDRGLGSCALRHPKAGKIIKEALEFYDGDAYTLGDWVVMPNHIHFVYTQPNRPVGKICKDFKSYTGLMINRLVGRSGKLWQRDYHDRYARDAGHLSNMRFYTLLNPVKAKLADDPFDWEFSSVHEYEPAFKDDIRRWYRHWRKRFWEAPVFNNRDRRTDAPTPR